MTTIYRIYRTMTDGTPVLKPYQYSSRYDAEADAMKYSTEEGRSYMVREEEYTPGEVDYSDDAFGIRMTDDDTEIHPADRI